MWFIVAAFCFGLSFFLPSGQWRLDAVTLVVFSFNFGLFKVICKHDQRFFGYKFYLVGALLIPLYFFLNIVFFPETVEEMLTSTLLFTAYPWSLYSLCLAPLMATVFAVLVGRPMSHRVGITFDDYFNQADRTFEVLSLCMLAPVYGTWLNSMFPSLPGGYWLAIINKTFAFFPVIAGYRFKRNPTIGLVWAGSLFIGLGLAFVTGNRGMGFFPAWFFAIGFGLSVKRKGLYFIGMGFLMVLALYASGVSSAIREATGGRKSLRELDIASVVEAWPQIVAYMSNSETTAGVRNTNPFHKGLKRMVPWTRVVVPDLTGEQGVPKRMFRDITDDALAFFSFTKLNRFTGIRIYPTVMNAAPYGFTVNLGSGTATGSTATSTVPFGFEMDGWSRFGGAGASLYIAIMLASMALIERINQRINRRNPNIRLLCLCVVWGLPFDYFGVYGLIHSFRQYILQFMMALFLAYFADKVARQVAQALPFLASKRHSRRSVKR